MNKNENKNQKLFDNRDLYNFHNLVRLFCILVCLPFLFIGFYTCLQDGNTISSHGQGIQLIGSGYEGLEQGYRTDSGGQKQCIREDDINSNGEASSNGDADAIGYGGATQYVQEWKLLEGDWHISSYYTPVKGQTNYYLGSYQADYNINCQGDCFTTASGVQLTQSMKYQIVACPPEFPIGTKFQITLPEDHKWWAGKTWIVTCWDRGGSIKGKRIDLWAGIGQVGKPHPWIGELDSDKAKISIINK